MTQFALKHFYGVKIGRLNVIFKTFIYLIAEVDAAIRNVQHCYDGMREFPLAQAALQDRNM